jgi:hypothetical protein
MTDCFAPHDSQALVHAMLTGSPRIDAERAFARASRARLRAKLVAWLRHRMGSCRLRVFGGRSESVEGAVAVPVLTEIPVAAIVGTVEPSRVALFDRSFRPARAARARWQRIWLAERRGAHLPPISVMRVLGGYAVRDGHHRVSVARALGASTIDAVVE